MTAVRDDRREDGGDLDRRAFAVRERQPAVEGEEGALIANATAKPRKIQTLSLVPESTRLNVPCVTPKATTDASISNEPAIV